jgi:putative DNA primase/helicase
VRRCAILLTGRECAVVSQATEDTEFEKKLGAILLTGDPLVSIDNCTKEIDHPLLCMAVTEPLIQIRILGFLKTATIPNGVLIFATGNNFRFAGDMLDRGLVARLDAKVERPQLRTFKSEDPIIVFKRDRAYYVVQALTALRAYLHVGQPEAGTPLGGFEGWSRRVRDCLVWLGEEDPVATIESARNEDPELLQFAAVIAQWEIHLGRRRVAAKDVVEVALQREGFDENDKKFVNPELRSALLAVAGDDGRISTVRLGRWLGKHKNRVAGGRRIVAAGIIDGFAQWRLQLSRDGGWE